MPTLRKSNDDSFRCSMDGCQGLAPNAFFNAKMLGHTFGNTRKVTTHSNPLFTMIDHNGHLLKLKCSRSSSMARVLAPNDQPAKGMRSTYVHGIHVPCWSVLLNTPALWWLRARHTVFKCSCRRLMFPSQMCRRVVRTERPGGWTGQ